MTNTNKPIISRRSRPAKAPLSKETIITTALELLRKDGLTGLSMRKVAVALDTGPASLYVYVANLNELNGYVLDLALGDVILPSGHEGPWKTRLLDLLQSYLSILYQSPGLAELAQTTIPSGSNYLQIMETILGILVEAGLESTAAAWGVDLLLLYATSVAFEQSSRDHNGIGMDPLANIINSLDSVKFPHIFNLKTPLFSGGETRFKWGLEIIMNGILHTPSPSLHEWTAPENHTK
ncbi:transcriptional regulator, TetR family [Paenibacillus sp. 1_12]|uniref:TetR/AcrR family transcriptional regulator n=1 Tax=Paenibacillus sp. 1_12 TaxID=1566278 RepID=UPI0008F01593|nr:TetR/AcrR family transcriptional regulator C-terminal domain-containing protein [Paenibacillus sp. 1_12]SFL95422.1 transcriptional regulator, TetR family [Paenibacillus sp. 1_12]